MTNSARKKAYEAEKDRLDARKTSRRITCTPPNKKCGGRCIPPAWDCRLKNEGTDKHLMAVKTDPLKGAASIQRGISRLAKGIATGNIAEVQGGRGAITRGIVTTTPGNIQQKKKLRETLDKRTRFIGTALLLGVGGYALHTQAKKYGPYKKHVGNIIDRKAAAGYNAALDRMPILGSIRENNRRAAGASTARTAEAILKGKSLDGRALSEKLAGEGADNLSSMKSGTDSTSRTALTKAMGDQDNRARTRNHDFNTWDTENRTTFLGVQRSATTYEGKEGTQVSIYAEPAAQSFLRGAYGLKGREGSTLREELRDQFKNDKADYIRFAKQSGFKIMGGESEPHVDPAKAESFAIFATKGEKNEQVREQARKHIQELVGRGGTPTHRADKIYTEAVGGFNSYYQRATENSRVAPGTPLLRDQRNLAQQADIARARHLASKMKGVNLNNIGPSVSEVVRKGYYATQVASRTNKATYSLTARQFQAAATEIAGRPVPTVSEAQGILKNAGFTGATYVKTAQTEAKKAAPKSTKATKSTKPKPSRQSIMRAQSELAKKYREQGLSPEAAMKAAAKEIRERGDALTPYEIAYLEARYDFKETKSGKKGKKCGESYIPKKHTCQKKKRDNKHLKTAAKVAAVAAAATGAVVLARKAKLNEFGTAADLLDPRLKVRKRKLGFQDKNQKPMSSNEVATSVAPLLGQKGVLNKNVETFQKFTMKQGITVDSKKMFSGLEESLIKAGYPPGGVKQEIENLKLTAKLGISDGFATPFSNSIYVRSSRKDIRRLNADGKDVVKSVNSFMDRRAADQDSAQGFSDAKKKLFSTYRNTNDGDTSELITMIHETAHQAHFRATRNSGVTRNDQIMENMFQQKGYKGESPELQKQLERAVSNYGRSDVNGKRAETFAELSVLYVASGERFKKENPLAYNWVDSIWKKSLES